jgi:hypothetical protein
MAARNRKYRADRQRTLRHYSKILLDSADHVMETLGIKFLSLIVSQHVLDSILSEQAICKTTNITFDYDSCGDPRVKFTSPAGREFCVSGELDFELDRVQFGGRYSEDSPEDDNLYCAGRLRSPMISWGEPYTQRQFVERYRSTQSDRQITLWVG